MVKFISVSTERFGNFAININILIILQQKSYRSFFEASPGEFYELLLISRMIIEY